ncbi:MAG: glycine--tRNA ligase subunit beta, partial [Desulfovibrio sp.]|nr:glycine--tRNA ligase subunit beta [Desulfovibrio sp.]
LLPYFLTVINLEPDDLSVVKQGWERVLHARLEDARFFWREDLKANFETWLAKLDQVIFIGPLGSMGEKTRRLSQLAVWLCHEMGIEGACDAERAARLSKADLVSGMVGEFDTLQGIMGSIYAQAFGENTVVAQALREQYLPQGPESSLPKTTVGALLSLADKADTLVGCFGLNKIPTGNADPFALRRCALGIIRICQANQYPLDLQRFFAKAQSLYGERKWKLGTDSSLVKLQEFILARLKHYLELSEDVLLVDAVLKAPLRNIPDVFVRLEAMRAFQKTATYVENVQMLKRIGNILQKQQNSVHEWDSQLFVREAEHRLADFVSKLLSSERSASYLLAEMDTLRPLVNAFFTNVMVLDKDAQVRVNRFALLAAIDHVYGMVADFSALQI